MNVEAHILCYCEQDILPYSLRHYATFCDRIILHDGGSTDRSREIARSFGAEVRDMVSDGVNDLIFKTLKETCWKGTDADWVILVDADELIYFPQGPFATLSAYEAANQAVIKPHGFELVSDTFPTTESQIYDEVQMGARDDKWYGKPVLIAPQKIKSLTYAAGAHTCWAVLNDGTKISDPQTPSEPPTFLLHAHHLGPVERIGKRYAAQQSRHSQLNIQRRWGNFEDPYKHARDKRAAIMGRLERVIPA